MMLGLFNNKARNLPYRTTIESLMLQLGQIVVRIDNEQRSLVAHRHVLAVALQSKKHIVAREILRRYFSAIIVNRVYNDRIARSTHFLHETTHEDAVEVYWAIIPGSGRS